MYSYEEKMRAVQLYIKNDYSIAATIYELGYPARGSLYAWYKEYKEKGFSNEIKHHNSKFTAEQRKSAVDYWQMHGKSIKKTILALGYPGKTVLRQWINEDVDEKQKYYNCRINHTGIKCSKEQKEQAVLEYFQGERPSKEIAHAYGVTAGTLHQWKSHLLGKGSISQMPLDKRKHFSLNKDPTKNDIEELRQQNHTLELQRQELLAENHRLQLQNDVLKMAGELIKKEKGINLDILTNREKAVLINALRKKYRLLELLNTMQISKSSYCYQATALKKPDKYEGLREIVKSAFSESKKRYGYRRIHMVVKKDGVSVSEKVVRRIMKEENLAVFRVVRKGYSSYQGEITPSVDNIIQRDFHAEKPNMKWLTDITEFHIPAGKIYLSPIIDCFDGLPVSWSISTAPDAELVNTMLDGAISTLKSDEKPIVHSDRGAHYRWPGWIERMSNASLQRSMSKKGCSPDNSACEGFFGRLKNEMFYGLSWVGVTIEEFIALLDGYMRWYCEDRIKMSLGAMSPLQYRKSLGLIS